MLRALTVLAAALLAVACSGDREYAPIPAVPAGLPPVPVPEDGHLTPAKVELGKLLFFDERLSRDRTVSCATCHDPKAAWAEHRKVSFGIQNQMGPRNSPTVLNAAYLPVQFWDGRAKTLEEQAAIPIETSFEMGHNIDRLVISLSTVEIYEDLFEEVYGTGVTREGLLDAIAAFERTLLTGNSPYDRHVAGDRGALTEEQELGLELFTGKADCASCHPPPIFSDGKFYNAGIHTLSKKIDEGRKVVTDDDRDLARFRTPHLREVALTAPYFHDGSVQTLLEAVRIMAAGGIQNDRLSKEFAKVREAKLTETEVRALAAFLEALSGEFPIHEPPD